MAVVAVVAEQYWHRIPGGTGVAADATLRALVDHYPPRFEFTGVAAWHRRAAPGGSPIPIDHQWLPRPLLYEAWHRLGHPRVPGRPDLIWAPAMVVPPPTAPTVVTVNDLDFLEHPERLSRRGRSFFPRACRATLERADVIVCPTRVTADAVVANGALRSRVRTVSLGVDPTEATAGDVDRLRRRYGLPDQFVLFVGTVEPRKNLPGLVEAMTRLDLPLVVAGPGGWVVDERDLLAPLGSRVQRMPFLTGDELRALYRAATVFALPSLAEGFGLPVLEAMAQSTPVVTSRGTSTEEVARGAALLIDPRDPAEIADAIESLVSDGSLCKDLAQRGRERAMAQTWQATASGYADVFDEVLG